MKYWSPVILLLLILLHTTVTVAYAGDEQPTPLPAHCGGAGPLPLPLLDPADPEFCGCTWGVVYYRGEPIVNARVVLAFDNRQFRSNTAYNVSFPEYPYYVADGKGLGAHRSDVMTVTVDFAGETFARPFRAWPAADGESKGEQEISIVLAEEGAWQPLLTGGYTRTLTIDDQTLWAGGNAGLTAYDLATQIATPQALPWAVAQVTAFAVGPQQSRWVAGPHHLATWNGTAWNAVAAPLNETIRSLVFTSNGVLWVGGGDSKGALAYFDGQTWQTVNRINEPITTLVVDAHGGLWAGTWDGGVYQLPAGATDLEDDWIHYRTADGLAGDLVRSATTDAHAVWFGTEPFFSSAGYGGGLSRYDLTTQSWQTFTNTHNLPLAADLPNAPGRTYALTTDDAGYTWVGTAGGVYRQVGEALWVTDTLTTAPVTALATTGDLIFAAQTNGEIMMLDRSLTPGSAPSAQFDQPIGRSVLVSETLQLRATATDSDEAGKAASTQILAWDWQSDRDGPLCTTAEICQLPADQLSVGEHTITLRVQDDEGVWSTAVTTAVTVVEVTPTTEEYIAYLPFIVTR